MALVLYSSDSDDEKTRKEQVIAPKPTPITRKRALPALPDSFPSGSGPNDDPELHQGRKRTRPYVDGDHDTHIYISLEIPKRLSDQIESLLKRIQDELPKIQLHPYLSKASNELHISLSHAFPLRRSQIPQFKLDFRRALKAHSESSEGENSLRISLGGKVRVYRNGRRYGGEGHGGRTFLALQVGAGAKEIDGIVQAVIHPLLKTLHRPLYHTNPEYHASFAWCLTNSEASQNDNQEIDDYETDDEIPPCSTLFPEKLLRELEDEFEMGLLSVQPTSGWSVNKLMVKIGKDALEVHL